MEASHNTYLQAKELFLSGMAPTALELLGFRLAACPNDAQSAELQGLILHSMHRFKEAKRTIEGAGIIRELGATARLVLADCYWFTGEQKMASTQFLSLAKQEDLPKQLLSDLAMALGRIKAFHAAIDVCRRAALADFNNDQARYGIAFYMSKAGYPPEFVLPIVHKLVELTPSIFFYRMAMATLFCHLGKPERAYLTIADATLQELETITCRGCVRRLFDLYKSSNDQQRMQFCRKRLQVFGPECDNKTC